MHELSRSIRFFVCLAITLIMVASSARAAAPTLADLIENNLAFLKLDKRSDPTAFGSKFHMHFISTVSVHGEIWTYYIKWDESDPSNHNPPGGVGLAKSTDGITFNDFGWVLKAGNAANSWDRGYASFPGVWHDDATGTFYLVYEGMPAGDIGLATSTDGYHFTKQGVILRHNPSGWERANIGTPSLYKEGSTWYLHYHGYDGNTCQIGVASGPRLMTLTKNASNPIIHSIPNTWVSGTAGHRDIKKVNGRYYMVFEGSGPQPYSQASWSSGFATSGDLVYWVLYSQDPVLPQTTNGFGNDGPTFLDIEGQTYIYFRGANGLTHRALIANEAYGSFDQVWSMSSNGIGHKIGKQLGADWSVDVSERPGDYMQFGPYVELGVGDQIATWKLMIDNNRADNLKILRLEVTDFDDNSRVLGQREITRLHWRQANRYEYFSVPFHIEPAQVHHRIELRVFWYGNSFVREQLVGIS